MISRTVDRSHPYDIKYPPPGKPGGGFFCQADAEGLLLRSKAVARRPFLARPSGACGRLCTLLSLAVFVGGGGIGAALPNLVVQLAAMIILAWDYPAVVRFVRQAPRPLVILLALSLCLPVAQLVPLPPQAWSALPGRQLVADSLALIGHGDAWMPVSVAPMNTFIALLGLMAPAAILVLGWSLDERDRDFVWLTLMGLAVAGTFLGAVQLASSGTAGVIQYQAYGEPELHATFANRNSAGLFFVFAMLGGLGWLFVRPRGRGAIFVIGTLLLLFALDLLLTRSRSSIVIGAVIVPLMLAFYAASARCIRRRMGRRHILVAAVALMAFVGGAFLLLGHSSRLQSTVQRFDSVTDVRPLIWSDTLAAIHRYGLVGSGMGTFDEVFQVDESLEYLDGLRAGRAHNDWLEITLEAGVVGALLVLAWAGWIAYCGFLGLRKALFDQLAALGIIACVAIQSILDYPLRNEALFCIAAFAASQLVPRIAGRDRA